MMKIAVIEDCPLRIELRDETLRPIAHIAIPDAELPGLAAKLTRIANFNARKAAAK